MVQETTVVGQYEDLRGKRVLVTGASAGIGRAAALAFDKNGAHVAVLGRRLERLEAVVKQMQHGHAVVADLSVEEECKKAVAEAIEKLGGLDILVNNGGVSAEGMQEDSADSYIVAIKLHVTSAFTIITEAKDALIKSKGAIVNISSIAAEFATNKPEMISYGVAKAAQDALTRSLALQLAPQGVRVNSILPAVIQTEAIESWAERMGAPIDKFVETLGKLHPMGRVAQPVEVAAPILFLASSASSFITGVQLPVDGGALLSSWFNKEAAFGKPE